MNRILRSRLSGIAFVSLLALVLAGGCGPNWLECVENCAIVCSPFFGYGCIFTCPLWCCNFFPTSEECENIIPTSDECAATFKQLQIAAIEICEKNPEECQQVFDAWVESFRADAEE